LSAEDIQTLLHMSPTITSEEVAKIFTMLQGFRAPLDEDFFIEFGIQADEIRLRSTTENIRGADVSKTENRTRSLTGGSASTTLMRAIKQNPNLYALTHTENAFSGITFPQKDTRYGGRLDCDGIGYITVGDATRLNPTAELAIVGFMYIPSAVTVAADEFIVHKDNAQYSLKLTTKTNMRLTIDRSGGQVTHDRTVPNDAWFSFGFSYDSTNGFRSYIDKVESTAAQSGAILVTATNLGILARADGTGLLENTIRLGPLSILNGELTQAWINDYHDGLLNTDPSASPAGFTEILTYLFTSHARPVPEITLGIARVE